MPVNIAQAALGAEVNLLTFDGLETVKVPEGSQTGSRIRLKNLGVPRLQAERPWGPVRARRRTNSAKLTREQRKLFESFARRCRAENEPHEKGIIDRVKDYFM